jgi:hypothetical protein
MVTVRFVLTKAYGVNDYQIVGPDWLDRDRFDIDATMPAGTTMAQFRTMLQNLLADRFKMASHKETREFSGFSLVVGKGGPKLRESADSPAPADDGAPDPPLKPGADGYFPAPESILAVNLPEPITLFYFFPIYKLPARSGSFPQQLSVDPVLLLLGDVLRLVLGFFLEGRNHRWFHGNPRIGRQGFQ